MAADSAVAAGVLAAVNAVEGAVDEELQRLENLDEDGLSQLREQRLQQLKKDARQVNGCPSEVMIETTHTLTHTHTHTHSVKNGRHRDMVFTQKLLRKKSSLMFVKKAQK